MQVCAWNSDRYHCNSAPTETQLKLTAVFKNFSDAGTGLRGQEGVKAPKLVFQRSPQCLITATAFADIASANPRFQDINCSGHP